MIAAIRRYIHWLHTQWPAGEVEPFPEVREDGGTAIPGLYVAGDLAGIPLLKFALDTGARVVERIAADPTLRTSSAPSEAVDLAILGAGVAGMAAAREARERKLSFELIEASEPFSTLVNFPSGKPIYTYPLSMKPRGALQVAATVKEALVEELRGQAAAAGLAARQGRAERVERRPGHLLVHLAEGAPVAARRVLVALGRSGDFRRLGVPGEDLATVYNRLHDPADFSGRHVVVVGGGDSALETALALAGSGAHVTLAHRGPEFARPKSGNLERLRAAELSAPAEPTRGSLAVRLGTRVREIREREVALAGASGEEALACDAVFVMIGREAPVPFFRRSGIPIAGEMTPRRWAAFSAFVLFCAWLYNWKSGGFFSNLWYQNHWFPTNLPELLAAAGGWIAASSRDPGTLVGTLAISASGPSFWYTLAYSIVVVVFGIRRIRRRRTPYVTAQTLVLMSVQVLPLFLIPEIILPLLSHHGALPAALADALFPVANYGHGREFWRAYGLILAWPLDVYNIFTHQPLWWWIGIGFVQTCVLIPLGIRYFGKGFYCGWICSCGALAETLGDTHRQKMPHGAKWNRLNVAGQVVLAFAVLLLVVRIVGWIAPEGNAAARLFESVLEPNYKWMVDVTLAGVVGYGAYFWYSGRVWCRFFCPLAALMHIYARFSRFRIWSDKKKCISCGQCTAMCHQGIDVMSFANKGLPMADPECVRCSACVHVCPTGVLSFGQAGANGQFISVDSLLASPVQIREGK